MRSPWGHGPSPTASQVLRLLRRIRKRVPPSRIHSGQALRGLDRAPLSRTPTLELAPRAGRLREGARVSGRSGSACPESGTVCRIVCAALRLSGKRWSNVAMAPRKRAEMRPGRQAGDHAARLLGHLLAWMARKLRGVRGHVKAAHVRQELQDQLRPIDQTISSRRPPAPPKSLSSKWQDAAD